VTPVPPLETDKNRPPSTQLDVPKRTRRYRLLVSVLIVGAAVVFGVCRPRYRTITVAGERTYDIRALSRDARIPAMFGLRADSIGPAVVVDYFGVAADTISPIVPIDMLTIGRPVAEANNLRMIVVKRTEPVVSRWIWLVKGGLDAFVRDSSGEWHRLMR
jgi:hypothetical protein